MRNVERPKLERHAKAVRIRLNSRSRLVSCIQKFVLPCTRVAVDVRSLQLVELVGLGVAFSFGRVLFSGKL